MTELLRLQRVSLSADDLAQELGKYIASNSKNFTFSQSEVDSGSATTVGAALTGDGIAPAAAVTAIRRKTWNPLLVRTTPAVSGMAELHFPIHLKSVRTYSLKTKKQDVHVQDYALTFGDVQSTSATKKVVVTIFVAPFILLATMIVALIGMFVLDVKPVNMSAPFFTITGLVAVLIIMYIVLTITEHHKIQNNLPTFQSELSTLVAQFKVPN